MSAPSYDLVIRGGAVHDPANGIDGEVRDLWVSDARVVDPPADPQARAARTLDARGLVVMPGGVDIHCHIAGSKVNLARKMEPEAARQSPAFVGAEHLRSGTLGPVPSTFSTGYRYASLGYTTAFDAAIQPLAARHVHEEFEDTPCIDKGFFILIGNSHYLMEAIRAGDHERARAFLAWLLRATGAYGLKLVNPGGIEMWKQMRAGNIDDLDQRVGYFDVTPRQILQTAARAADELGLPHPVHVHCNHLGIPGNWKTTLETMRALEGHRAHFAHIQFHSYGGDAESSLNSRTVELAEFVNTHEGLTVDVGQVLFGKTTTMTGDGPVGHLLHQIYGGKWYSADIEQESGCGIVPVEYKRKSLVHSWQWAIGLEWQLLVADPWKIAMSTDHPNGGSFLAYPQIVRLLMERDYRDELLAQVHPEVREGSALRELDREYSLQEICILTRAAPARMLGLAHKGHLGPGADADITIYDPTGGTARMFECPKYVLKGGRVIVDDHELRAPIEGTTLHAAPEYDQGIETHLREWFSRHYSIQYDNYVLRDDEFPARRAVSSPV